MGFVTEVSPMASGAQFLADLVHYRTYAAVLSDGRKESRRETIDRCKQMHLDKFGLAQADQIHNAFEAVHHGMVVPSMRTLQFSGDAVRREPARAYNCSYTAIKRFKDFADCLYLLCCGTGFGFSAQRMFINNLPAIQYGNDEELFAIPDSKEGWADSITKLLENPRVNFYYDYIRPYGAPLSSGGWASGPEPLRKCHELIRLILMRHINSKLSPLEVADIVCYIADAIVVAGTRRSALICLFDPDDEEMLSAKTGNWWEQNPQRARMNMSAVVHRQDPLATIKAQAVVQSCFRSGTGEPGLAWTNDYNYGLNPCAEISLRAFCNLTEINVAACQNKDDLMKAAWAATYIGTLQATYTDFSYIHSDWKKYADEEALLGVSLTGQAMNWPLLSSDNLRAMGALAVTTNREYAYQLGINEAHRIGTTKPSGSTSAWLGRKYGVPSGVHSGHGRRHLRSVRVDINNPLGAYLLENYAVHAAESGEVLEFDKFNSHNIVVTMPVEMNGCIIRDDESAVQLMNRARHIHENWIRPTHNKGPNTHNVSLTVSYKPEEESDVLKWMLDNRDSYAGMALLPFDGGSYVQAPFRTVPDTEFESFQRKFDSMNIDLAAVNWLGHSDQRIGESACGGAGGGCEVA
jgi:ribonucleoside-triphosphate reductase (thioredoxin)